MGSGSGSGSASGSASGTAQQQPAGSSQAGGQAPGAGGAAGMEMPHAIQVTHEEKEAIERVSSSITVSPAFTVSSVRYLEEKEAIETVDSQYSVSQSSFSLFWVSDI